MIHAQTISGGRNRRDALIFAPHDLSHGKFLSAITVKQAEQYIFGLEDIWAR